MRVLEVNQFRELRGPARHECPQSDEYVKLKELYSLYEGAFSHLEMPEAQDACPLVDLPPLKPHRGLTEIAVPLTMQQACLHVAADYIELTLEDKSRVHYWYKRWSF